MSTPSPDTGDERGLLLRRPAPIESLLHRLRLNHAILSVRLAGAPRWYSSLVIAVGPNYSHVDLDALHPPPLTAPTAGTGMAIHARIDGGDLRLRSEVIGPCRVEKLPALRIAFPHTAFVRERRINFRLPLSPRLGLAPSHIVHAGTECHAPLADISTDGAAALLSRPLEAPIGSSLQCQIDLPGLKLDTEAELRSSTAVRHGWRVGMQFAPLQADRRERLQRAILALERHLIRTRAARS
ncbi:flagellar brake protein [Sinimarinibacterium sp. CAU 1509]|uniref:flagellar brake protein n=1 Tax=Sinimarinibacterium sp. CAU 1509 TaxID=2562283 RepID=UPI0010AD3417|nr:PilZ domain-containing protein [Sinimarinibacterium sp. CAU 1509]TJY62883.1 flagellar brake protein [Sinimarinibacterium sp. CAU 1509]